MSQGISPSLAERRAFLREAEAGRNQHDIASFEKALSGSNEEERAALAKTLPPSRLFNAEGGTPRAAYVLAALGKPKLVAETLAKAGPDLSGPVIQAARGRANSWTLDLCEQLADGYCDNRANWLDLAVGMQADQGLIASSAGYIDRMPYYISYDAARDMTREVGAQIIVTRLKQHQGLLMHAFWQFFQMEGMGSNWILTDDDSKFWSAAMLSLCETDPGFRERLLDESLGALLRDFSAKNILWYPRVHRLLEPTPQEIIARQNTYLAVLATAPSTAVGLAQDMLALVLKDAALDVDALIEASPAVLSRTEKKLVKAQLQMLAEIKRPGKAEDRILQVVGDALESMPLDIAALARKLFVRCGEPSNASMGLPASASASVSESPGKALANAVAVDGPLHTAKPKAWQDPPPIRSDEELSSLVAEHFEAVGHGADLPRMFHYLSSHPDFALSPELQQRAKQVIDTVWDRSGASPRHMLAVALLGVEGVHFKGYAEHVYVANGQPDPEGVELEDKTSTSMQYDKQSGEYKVVEVHTYRAGFRYLPTHSPIALLALEFVQLRHGRRHGQAFNVASPLVAHHRTWQREVISPPQGSYGRELEIIGASPKPFWLAPNAQPVDRAHASLETLALDVANVRSEFIRRVVDARDQDGYDQVVQWATWLLRDNPDTLAAQFHPMLLAATVVINVRGVGALLAALGASHQPPNGPVYSALALAASAKMQEQRAQAAEAIARLADAGLLDAERFAEQVAAHLVDDIVMAGRIAQTLADAASISALAGYRMLQTLQALLSEVVDADGKPRTQASKLVELAARLSGDYGTPLVIPSLLAARRKGASALAVAIRTLEAVQPQATELVEAAAAAARQLLAAERAA